jgi:hypothetical protein
MGTEAILDACAPAGSANGLEPARITEGAEIADGNDAVVAFDPSPQQLDALADAGLPAIVWLGGEGGHVPLRGLHRVVAGADGPGVWRSLGLPVADSLYAPAAPPAPGRAAWLGGVTERRREYLSRFEHTVDLHAGDCGVALNMHDDDLPAFEHRAARALAAGKLLVSETLVPARGLEPGIDYLEARDFYDMFVAGENAARNPAAYRRVQLRGRRKAEAFRASAMIARLVGDLLMELRSEGLR